MVLVVVSPNSRKGDCPLHVLTWMFGAGGGTSKYSCFGHGVLKLSPCADTWLAISLARLGAGSGNLVAGLISLSCLVGASSTVDGSCLLPTSRGACTVSPHSCSQQQQ